jgi:FdhD protein
MEESTTVSILRYTQNRFLELEDPVVTEITLSIVVNGERIAEVICSPCEIREFVTGFLFSEKLIRRREDINVLKIDTEKWTASVETRKKSDFDVGSGNARFITSGGLYSEKFSPAAHAPEHTKKKSKTFMSSAEVCALVTLIQSRSKLFEKTGGAHSAALWSRGRCLYFSEDIGRHNALDKIIGKCLLSRINTHDKTIATSGRLSSTVVAKVIHAGFPIVVSRSAPTEQAVALSKESGITMIGFARGDEFNIYSNEWRVRA